MNKKIVLFVTVIIIVISSLFIINNKTTNKNVEINNNVDKVEQIEEMEKNDKITQIEADLILNNDINNKEEIYSNAINESGYAYDLNGERIEVYYVDQVKMDNMYPIYLNDNEVIFTTLQGDDVQGLYNKNILILNCTKNKQMVLSYFMNEF